MTISKLLGEDVEEENCDVPEEAEHQIVVFQSTALDYINQQHYHGLVANWRECER